MLLPVLWLLRAEESRELELELGLKRSGSAPKTKASHSQGQKSALLVQILVPLLGLWLVLLAPLWLLFIVPGWISYFVVLLWYLFRCIKGWLRFNGDRLPIDLPFDLT